MNDPEVEATLMSVLAPPIIERREEDCMPTCLRCCKALGGFETVTSIQDIVRAHMKKSCQNDSTRIMDYEAEHDNWAWATWVYNRRIALGYERP